MATAEDRQLADWLLHQYTGVGRNTTAHHLPNITDLLTDAMFNYGIERWEEVGECRYLEAHLHHSTGRLYQYVNSHMNEHSQVGPPAAPPR